MYSKAALLSAIAQLVAADSDALFAAASSVNDKVGTLEGLVSSWSSADGLAGALVIQQSVDPLASAVESLVTAASGVSLTSDEVTSNIGTVESLGSSISGLLSALVDKAADFEAVGASSIVGGDVASLWNPGASAVSNLLADLPSSVAADDSSKINAAVVAISSAFAAAGSAYSTSGSASFPTGYSGSSDSSSDDSSSSSAAESTAAATTSEASAAVASSTGSVAAAASGYDATTTEVVTAFTTYCPSATTLVHGNKTYTVTEATTLTITDCPCTITKSSNVTTAKTTGTAVAQNGAAVAQVGAGLAAIAAGVFLL